MYTQWFVILPTWFFLKQPTTTEKGRKRRKRRIRINVVEYYVFTRQVVYTTVLVARLLGETICNDSIIPPLWLSLGDGFQDVCVYPTRVVAAAAATALLRYTAVRQKIKDKGMLGLGVGLKFTPAEATVPPLYTHIYIGACCSPNIVLINSDKIQ